MTIATAIVIWILAIICGIPAILGSNIKVCRALADDYIIKMQSIYTMHIIMLQQFRINSNNSFSFCYPFPEQWGNEYAKTIVLARFLIYYAVPLCIIGIFYIMIARHLVYSASVPGEIQGAMRQVSYITDLYIYYTLVSLYTYIYSRGI